MRPIGRHSPFPGTVWASRRSVQLVLLTAALLIVPTLATPRVDAAPTPISPTELSAERDLVRASGSCGYRNPSSDCRPESASQSTALSTGSGWLNVTGETQGAPPPRAYGRSVAYDPADGYLVVFGGLGANSSYLGDTWTYRNGTWTELHESTAPEPRDHSTLAWDPVDHYLVLFGGSAGGVFSDTWTFSAGLWTQLFPASHPSARWSSSLAWDAWDGYLVLFGGCSAGTEQNDTWTFQSGNWTELHPSISPPARGDAALTYDGAGHQLVLFSGLTADWGSLYGDTWVYSAGHWTELFPQYPPQGRSDASFAYDPALGAAVLFGGQGYYGVLDDTWWFDNGSWTMHSPDASPSPRLFALVGYDPTVDGLVLFGGSTSASTTDSDTWWYYTLNISIGENRTGGPAPLAIAFTGLVTGPSGTASYAWEFGDGGQSSSESPIHTYVDAGTFDVVLTVVDAQSVSSVTSVEVQTWSTLSASAEAAPTEGPVPLVTQFESLVVGGVPPYNWVWSTGTGQELNGTSGSAEYDVPGIYFLSVRVHDAAGDAWSDSFEINATGAGTDGFAVLIQSSRTNCTAPCPVVFSAETFGGTPPLQFHWLFGDSASSNTSSTAHLFLTAGVFDVEITVSDALGRVVANNASVAVYPPLGVLLVSGPSVAPLDVPVAFTSQPYGGEPPYAVLWSFGDGEGGIGGSVNHTFLTPGAFDPGVTVIDSAGDRADANSSPITVVAGGSAAGAGASWTSPLLTSGFELVWIPLAIEGGVALATVAWVLRARRGRSSKDGTTARVGPNTDPGESTAQGPSDP